MPLVIATLTRLRAGADFPPPFDEGLDLDEQLPSFCGWRFIRDRLGARILFSRSATEFSSEIG
jgi:hypothetical protein